MSIQCYQDEEKTMQKRCINDASEDVKDDSGTMSNEIGGRQ